MNRDTVVASTIGFSLGLVAAIMLWVVPRILPKNAPKPTPVVTSQEEAKPKDESPTTRGFSIVSPTDGEIVSEKSVTISGTAPGAQNVTITSSEQSLVIEPDSQSQFKASLTVTEGANQIVVTSLTKDRPEVKTLTVYQYASDI